MTRLSAQAAVAVNEGAGRSIPVQSGHRLAVGEQLNDTGEMIMAGAVAHEHWI